MNVNGIGAGYPAWRDKERTQRNGSGTGFAGRMADMVGVNADSRKTNAVSRRDNYVGENTANIYGMGVYSKKDIFVGQELDMPIETERYKIEDAQLAIQRDEKTGMEFVINMDQPFSCNVKLLDNDMTPFDYFGRSNKDNSVRESNKEINRTDREEKTETNIIVKPDGSRVLVVTMSIGGMETTMSLEISKPTEAPNENSEHDIDNNMPSGDAGMDAVSDEMSDVSTEA